MSSRFSSVQQFRRALRSDLLPSHLASATVELWKSPSGKVLHAARLCQKGVRRSQVPLRSITVHVDLIPTASLCDACISLLEPRDVASSLAHVGELDRAWDGAAGDMRTVEEYLDERLVSEQVGIQASVWGLVVGMESRAQYAATLARAIGTDKAASVAADIVDKAAEAARLAHADAGQQRVIEIRCGCAGPDDTFAIMPFRRRGDRFESEGVYMPYWLDVLGRFRVANNDTRCGLYMPGELVERYKLDGVLVGRDDVDRHVDMVLGLAEHSDLPVAELFDAARRLTPSEQ